MPPTTTGARKRSNQMPWEQERCASLGVHSDTALWVQLQIPFPYMNEVSPRYSFLTFQKFWNSVFVLYKWSSNIYLYIYIIISICKSNITLHEMFLKWVVRDVKRSIQFIHSWKFAHARSFFFCPIYDAPPLYWTLMLLLPSFSIRIFEKFYATSIRKHPQTQGCWNIAVMIYHFNQIFTLVRSLVHDVGAPQGVV